ncbi:tetraspanin-19 isoform X2 [Phoenix dactylifera]|uniref:Tetraspanin-19 isoform X2 n=1 Tax=Phoenix dactylifera TaxID=42345 RepID=A0A8B7CU07_PHODC|nr:tetraspanin-19 isoform X2 [Phoenix dactylifera]
MGRMVRSCLQSLLKLVNSVIGLVGMGMILYSFWMIRVWFRQVGTFWAAGPDSTPPWFIYTFLGLGVTFCLITCSGHVAAETANGHCLSCYMVLVFLLVMLEAAITADVFLNKDWEEDFPEDPTGRLNDFKNFVKRNFEMCKWVGLVIIAAQALSIFLAIIIRALGPDCASYYDSDDDYVPARLPLLKNHVQRTPYIVDPHVSSRNDSWNVNR